MHDYLIWDPQEVIGHRRRITDVVSAFNMQFSSSKSNKTIAFVVISNPDSTTNYFLSLFILFALLPLRPQGWFTRPILFSCSSFHPQVRQEECSVFEMMTKRLAVHVQGFICMYIYMQAFIYMLKCCTDNNLETEC